MTEETLAQTLQSRGLLTYGTAQERVARLEEADRTCTMPVTGKKMVFPSFTNEALAREVYVTLAAGCLGIEACIDVPIIIPGAMNYSRAVHFSVELDLRTPTLKVQFESCHHEILLFDNNIDFQEDFKLSDFTFLKLRLKKGDGDKWYTLGLGLKLQLGLDLPAIIDAMVVEDFHLHIPSISDFSLPGDGSLRGLAKLTGNRLSFGAVRFFLKTLKLDNILTEGKCEDYELTEPDCPWNIDVHKFLPDSLKDKVTCVMTPNCLGIQCCHEVSLKLPLMSTPLTMQLPFSFVFSPCDNMKVRVAVGSFSKEEQLLNYELGQTRELTIGKGQYDGEPSPLTIKYAISHYRKVEPKYEEGFLLDLKVRLCLPFDGKSICFPTDEDDGFDVLTKQKVPVCSPDTLAEIKNFNLTAFLEVAKQPANTLSLNRSLALTLLNKFSITDSLDISTCDMERDPYTPAVNGWRNECPLSTQYLPTLSGQRAVCHLSKACNRVDCCLHSSFLGLNLHVWLEMNCDLYLQAGIERLSTPRLYVMGGEVDWKQGIKGELNISEAFRIGYVIRKVNNFFELSMTVKVCFDGLGGDCQLSVTVLENTRIPQLGCHPSALSYFNDLFKWKQCVLPTGDTDCQLSLPSFFKGRCVLTDDCLRLQCCVPVELGFLGSYALSASFLFDRCNDSFNYTLEQKSGKLGLDAILGVQQKEEVGSAITFYYRVDSQPSGYKLSASLNLCALDAETGNATSCFTYDLFPDGLSVYAPSSHCTAGSDQQRRRRRRKRQAGNEYACDSSLSLDQLIRHMIGDEDASLEDIERCMEALKTKEESRCESLNKGDGNQAAIFSPKAIMSGLGNQNPSTLLFCQDSSILKVDVEGGEQIYKMLKKVEDIRGTLDQLFVPGAGMTAKGAKALSFKMANMTIGQLQAYVMAEGVDPQLAFQLMKDMKDLLYSLYTDIMTSITEGGGGDLFKSFDLSITGDFSVPRQSKRLFKYSYFFVLAGIVPMTFEFQSDITSAMKVEVGAHILQMQLSGQLTPSVSLRIQGSLKVGAVLVGELRLTGYICELALPSEATITFSRFPLDLTLTMDLALKPLELRLAALVSVEINLLFTSFRKTLHKFNLWHYVTPTITKRVLSVGQSEPDSSPPQFLSYEDDSNGQRRRRSQTTDRCVVSQLPDLDYTEPAVEIAVAASDDKSRPTLQVLVGSSPGLQDVLLSEMGGPSTILRQHLGVSGQPLYFTVRATNNAGASRDVTCSLDTYDVTLPQGRLQADYPSTSNRHVLSGSLVVHEDSPLVSTLLAVGLGKGQYAGGVRPWLPVTLTDRSAIHYDAARDTDGTVALERHFAGFQEGRLIVTSARLSRDLRGGMLVGECARQCLALTKSQCMSFNYHYSATSGRHCELLAAIAEHDGQLAVADNYVHYERLGVGMAHEFVLEVPMVHNSLYFFNIFLENSLHYVHIISSHGTIVDLTPPHPGPINITSDVLEIIPCMQNVPSDRRQDWLKWCRGIDPSLPNHRILWDGPGSATLFNGHTPLTDLNYTKANTYVSANWDGIHDYESGILGYTLTVGREVCEEWLHPHHDPHKHLVPIDDDDQWTNIGVVNTPDGSSLPDGKYYITIRALNEVKNGGPLSLTVCHTTPYVIDTSPPEVYEVYSTTYDEETFIIATKFNASDVHSDVHEVALCLGYSVLNCGVLPWQDGHVTNHVTEGGPANITFQIPGGVPVWVRLRIENGVELQAVGHALHPIIVDVTPPIPGVVNDGPVSKHDLAFSKDQYQYCANWHDFADPESGIAYYMGTVTSSEGDPLTNLTVLDRRSHMTCMTFDSPPLLHNHMYRFLLYAFNGGHKQLNVSQSSDGVLIDLTPPVTGDVIDGLRPDFEDVRFSVHQATVAAQWRGFLDPESGIAKYEVQVERAANLSKDFRTLKPWGAVPLTASSYENHGFQLRHRDVVRTAVRATNGALGVGTQQSDSFIVDFTPPTLLHLWDGLGAQDIQFQSDVTQLDASFEFKDEESGMDHLKYQVFQSQHGHRTQLIPPSRNGWVDLPPGALSSVSVPDLSLTPGLKYFLRVAAVNQAGSVATYDTDGVLVDPSPPSMDYVHVGVLSAEEEEVLIEGHVLQSDGSGFKAAWLATDHESGVGHYQVAVGTSAGSTDVLTWQDRGRETDGYIGGLSLRVTDDVTNTPLYYVSVRAINGAGDVSVVMTSNAIRIVQEDEAGVVTDGAQQTVELTQAAISDSDVQLDRWAMTVQFSGFTSHAHGLRHFDWALGTSPGAQDVMDFTALGILHDEGESGIPGNGVASRGVAQTVLLLQPGQTYYSTVRAFSNGGNAVQSVSDGVTVDITPPRLALVSLSKETNSSQLLPSSVLYQTEADALSAEWTVSDLHSDVVSMRYAIGTYPGADDVEATTEAATNAEEGALPSSGLSLNTEGRPNLLTLWAEDSVGLVAQVVSPAVVVDVTPPEQGEITCPSFVQPYSPVQCQWKGFRDAQSVITSFTIFVGTEPGLSDVIAPVTLSAYVTRYAFMLPSQGHNTEVHASLVVTNAVGLTTAVTSAPMAVDVTPPLTGTVVELRDSYHLLAGNASATKAANRHTCDSQEECLAMDVVCQESMTSVLVAWSPFQDPETSITKYEVAVGTSAGGGQLRALEEVPPGQRFHMVTGLNLMGQKQIFATVKATNGAGSSSTATSNGVFLSYLSQGLSPPGPVVVWDGDSLHGDLDFQTDLTSLRGKWTVEGDGCPAVRYQWAVERADGHRVSDFYDTEGETTSLNDGLQLTDLETYYQLVRVTNALGFTYTLRSDGITIHHEPLIPGQVFDGSKTGFDLQYQAGSTRVSANWQDFGSKTMITDATDMDLQAEDTVALRDTDERTAHQTVTRYEVALGTDRRYDSTRDNVVPWTDVGVNTSVTFYDLTLTPLHAIYYFSVRAYSASNSRAEVTSNGFYVGFDNGVTEGQINVGDYLSNASTVEVWWEGFYSDVGMFLYYVAISSRPLDNSSCQGYTDGGDLSDGERRSRLDIADRHNTGGDTYALLENLNMQQDSDVYIHVIGMDRAGLCRLISKKVHIDVTPPTAGQVKCGPYYDMAKAFAASATQVSVDWKSFDDAESPLTSFTLDLMTQPTCNVSADRGGDIILSVMIAANYSSYVFLLEDRGLSLTAHQPYFVRVRAENGAGLSTEVTSAPLLVDESLPVAGHVVDGSDFLKDETWLGSNTTVTASILHLATPVGGACPSRLLSFSYDGQWTLTTSSSSLDTSGRVLDLRTLPAKAVVLIPDEDSVRVTLTRDTNRGHMSTASLLHDADIARGGLYELDIQAADGDGHAVTSVTLWDGDDDDVIHYDFTPSVQTEFCLCCFDEKSTSPSPAECMSACDGCTTFMSDYQNRNAQVNDTTGTLRRRRSSGVHLLTEEEKGRLEAGESLDDVKEATRVRSSAACGFQLYTVEGTEEPAEEVAGSGGRLVLWCTFGPHVIYDPRHMERSLTFDPSATPHRYALHLFETADEAAAPTRCVSVTVDEDSEPTAELCGIPTLSPTTRLALSVWNWKNFLSDHDNGSKSTTASIGGIGGANPDQQQNDIALWQTSAIFSHVIIPANASKPCRYGDPFRGGQNPIVRYEAGIGSNSGQDDVVPFTEVNSPCLPCVHDCDEYECDPACDPSITLPLTLTLDNLDLPQSSETSDGEIVPLVYYFSVKAVLGSGRYTVVSSEGFSIDTTPPLPDPSLFFYLDAAQGEAKPVEALFASNTTIRVVYGCSDNESDIMEYEWAIGTTPGGEEVQNYSSTGLNPSGINDRLFGVITHNSRYYVSFKCTNGAGVQTTYEDPKGVVAFLEPLTVSDVTCELRGTEAIGEHVTPPTARQSHSSTSISVDLALSQDLTVDMYYFSIGSRKDTRTDDIFPRTLVAHRISGVISIRDGNVYKNDELMFPLRGAKPGFNGTASDVSAHESDFQMEPNREVFAFLDSCNEAQCTGPQLVGSVIVLSPRSHSAVSTNGTSIHVGLKSSGQGQRRKRSSEVEAMEREGEFDSRAPRWRRAVAEQVSVVTPEGLQDGQAVTLTEITQAELTTTYGSAASTDFVSYLADPTFTLTSVDTVDRILVGRAFYSPDTDVAFSLLSVGQTEMPGPVRITFPYNPSDMDSTVHLLHWNPDEQRWQRSGDTCDNETDTELKDAATSKITVKVCNTYGSGGGYFAEQTLFLLTSVNNTIPNDQPTLTSPTQLYMEEDEGTMLYQAETWDAEGDVVMVSLASPSLLPPDQAPPSLSLTPNNQLLFTPCLDCSGVYRVGLVLTEQEVGGIPPNTATSTLTITVTSVNDAPVSFLARRGASLLSDDPTADVLILLEQNNENRTETNFTFVFGTYDVEPVNGTGLSFTVQGPAYGTLYQGPEITVVPDCPSGSLDGQDEAVPCHQMSLPHDPTDLTWRYMTLTYRPDDGFHGYDIVRLLATDEAGLGSEVVTVKFGVMEMPCENGGTCLAGNPGYSCRDERRVLTFDLYYRCNCTEGYMGPRCNGDIDDCLSDPCGYPYVCVDLVDAYSCQCAQDNPYCDGLEGWMIGVIVIACIVVVGLVIVAGLFWAFRTGRLKKWRLFETRRPGSADSMSRLKIVEPSSSSSSDLAFSNQGFQPSEWTKAVMPVVPPFPKPPQMPTILLSPLPRLTITDHDDVEERDVTDIDQSLTQSVPGSPKMSRISHVNDPLAADHLQTFGLTIKPRRFQSVDITALSADEREAPGQRRTSEVTVHMHGQKLLRRDARDPRTSQTFSIGSADRSMTPVEQNEK